MVIKLKRGLTASGYGAYGLLVISLGLAGFAFADLLSAIFMSLNILAVLGMLCCIATAFLYPKPLTNPAVQMAISSKSFFKEKQIGLLWLGQIAFICLSLVLFHFLEKQTQLTTRLSFVETGYIMGVLQKNVIGLGLLPFVIYSVLGVGLAYFSVCLGEKPSLTRAFLFKQAGKPSTKFVLFCRNFVSLVVEVMITLSFVFIVNFTLFWLCETVNTYLGLDSLFAVPFRTLFILGLLIFVFQNINKKLIVWMGQHHISVGQVLIIYILAFALFLLWLHGSADWFTLSLPVSSALAEKSYFAGMLSEQALHTRIQYLIWGWWSIWIPWMASLIARSSIGFSIIRALVQALFVPIVVGWAIQDKVFVDWALVYRCLEWPAVKLLVLLGTFFFLWLMCGKMRTMSDVLRGAMLPIRRVSNRPLTRWMMLLMFWLTLYIPGGFILGWVPMQFMVTVSGLFMNIAVMMLMGVWGLSLLCWPARCSCRI